MKWEGFGPTGIWWFILTIDRDTAFNLTAIGVRQVLQSKASHVHNCNISMGCAGDITSAQELQKHNAV